MSDWLGVRRWNAVDRMNLLDVLFGDRVALLHHHDLPVLAETRGRIHVGFTTESMHGSYQPPDLIVIDDDIVTDTFAWLHAYAPHASPVSQFARIVARSDWTLVDGLAMGLPADNIRSDKWACLLFGETLAQGPLEVDITDIPLARAGASSTLAVARAATRYRRPLWEQECVKRLVALERDDRFKPRNVAASALIRMWRLLADAGARDLDAIEAASAVLDDVSIAREPSLRLWSHSETVHIANSAALFDESIEERVRAFNRAVDVLGASGDAASDVADAQIAVAAFLVGRGTSHAFLLRRVGRRFPTAQVWFALLAAMSGPRTWEADWSRAVKSMERLVRGSVALGDLAGVDLFWPEYAWIARTWDGTEGFTSLPRAQPSGLSVELLPGVSCQLRLALSEAVAEQRHQETERERVLSEYLRQFVDLASRARETLGYPPINTRTRAATPKSAATRSRRPKRSSGS